ncbi:MAG: BrnT family toxin [Treponema sp.]|jgi:uncharacterized DUF497 family protein|nr:BrnT family toxin [Treponema sp.]
MTIEWDERKNRINIKKHKIRFEHAALVFKDPLRKEYYDAEHSSLGEDRTIAIGFADTSILFVSFTESESETIHIISARRAKKHEMEDYNGNR